MRRPFVTADVFTTTKSAGNPLAVVLGRERALDRRPEFSGLFHR
jgi:predicted PhzF superfamily epimerase YddE/YHI9